MIPAWLHDLAIAYLAFGALDRDMEHVRAFLLFRRHVHPNG